MLAMPLLAFLRPEAPANLSQRTLTFAERVAYQRAIEDVYWRHRIWPKERPDAKPSLDAVMSQAQLERKVTDYLLKSQALEDYWERPITAEQLQAEMDRMAKHTKQPEVLRELFAALGNDSFIIAECLARPALAERLLTSWYGYDQRIHGDLKQRADADMQAHTTVEQMKELTSNYSEIEFIKSNRAEEDQRDAGQYVRLSSREWDEMKEKLAATFISPNAAAPEAFGVESADRLVHSQNADHAYENIPIGKLSRLQENDDRYYATAVVSKTNDRIGLATV